MMNKKTWAITWILLVILLSIDLQSKAEDSLIDDLISWWQFEDASGTIVDYMENNDGTNNGASYQETGKINYALGFDGSNDYISIPTIDIGTSHTISAWIYAEDLSYYEAILGYTSTSYMSPLLLINLSGNTYCFYHDGSAYKNLNLGEDITGSWHHLAVARDGTNVEFYLDGISRGSVTLDNNTNMYVDTIGARLGYSSLDFFFDGLIDELRIYDKKMESDEIELIFWDLVSSWHFEESSVLLADASGENDGTNNGASYQETGKVNYALGFDGSNDYVSTPTIDIGTSHTISAWIYAEDLSYYKAILGYTSDSYMSPLLLINLSGNTFCFYHDGNVYKNLNLGEDITENWHHLAVARDGTNVNFYLDGISRGSVTLDNNTNMYVDTIGARLGYSSLDFFFDGLIDELKIFERKLNADEIKRIFSSLAAWWQFEEASGSVNDVTKGITGTYNGSLYQESGQIHYALGLDGDNDYVSIPTIDIGTSHTISAWIYAEDLSYYEAILGYTSTSYMSPLLLINLSGNTYCFYHDGSAYKNLNLGEDITGSWHHLAVARDGTNVEFYLDGISRGSVTLDNNTNMYVDTIGARLGYSSLDFFFDGLIDELKIYKRSLWEEEILNTCLCGGWNMDEGTGTSVSDISDYANTASFVDMATSPWVPGHLNPDGNLKKALSFNDSGDYLSITSSSGLQTTGNLSISLWLKPTTIGVKQCNLVDKDHGGEYSLVLDQDGAVQLLQGKSQTAGGYFSATVIPSGSVVNSDWQHIVVTRNMSTREIKGYLDGELKNTVTYPDNSNYSPPAATSSDVKIGSGYVSDYNGILDKVRIYNMVLSETAINSMHLLTAYPNRSYYTTENPVAVCKLDIITDTGLDNCYMVAKDSQGNTLGVNTSPSKNTDLTYNISSLSNGVNTIVVELCNSSGERIYKYNLDIKKLAAKTGYEVKVDYQNGIVLQDGDGFFPIGLYLGTNDYSATYDLEDISDTDFNTIIRVIGLLAPANAQTILENAAQAQYNLNVIHRLESFYQTYNISSYKADMDAEDFWTAYTGSGTGEPYDVDQRTPLINAVDYAKNYSNLIGYYGFDEAHANQVEAGLDLYERTNAADGYHPTYTIYQGTVPEGDEFTNWLDILGVDSYWIPKILSGDDTKTIKKVCKNVRLAKQRADNDHKALWTVLLAEYFSGNQKRALYSEEQRSQTYAALINGSKGIFYWHYPIMHDSSWNILATLAEELDTLSPSLLMPELEQEVTYSSGTYDPGNDEFVDVIVRLYQAPASASYDYVLLACNVQEYPVDIDIDCSLLGSSGTVSRLFNASTYAVTNGEFSDQIDGYDTRAYTFTSVSTDPIEIDIDISTRTELDPIYEEETTVYSSEGRLGCTNLFPNPDLENYSLTNWPDYCWPYVADPRINTANQGWGLVDTPDKTALCNAIGSGDDPGETCLKIVHNGTRNGVAIKFNPDTAGKTYTISAYVKADANCSVRVGNTGGSTTPTDWDVYTYWDRINFTTTIPVKDGYYYWYFFIDTGTIYIDAIQIEETTANSPVGFTTN